MAEDLLPEDDAWSLRFEGGSLVLDGPGPEDLPEGFVWDARIGRARAPADRYAALVTSLGSRVLEDRAKTWSKLVNLQHLSRRTARVYQEEAVAAWKAARWRGVVVLPTGSGKSYVAERCIALARRSTLVVVPTLDLLSQWYGVLSNAFGTEIGLLGGGNHEIRDLTVTTYDSFAIYAERYGDRFGLLVFDEVHHLPAPGYLRAASSCMAPLRLGLTATLERPDGRHSLLDAVVGPEVYRQEIPNLAGDFLAPYQVEILTVALSEAEQSRYDALRATYKQFVASQGIRMGAPDGWQRFIIAASRSKEGRAAFRAVREARQLAWSPERKIAMVRDIVAEEWGRPTIIFTNDNQTALQISRMLLCPCITHRTEMKERRRYLDAFAKGELRVISTSRVLNEGVDLPAAEVAIIVSGTSTVRESVQRLGRILRPGNGKEAILYELVSEGTTETFASERRREHDAYR